MGKRSNGTRGTNSSNSAKSRKTNIDFTDDYSEEVVSPGIGIGSKFENMQNVLEPAAKGYKVH